MSRAWHIIVSPAETAIGRFMARLDSQELLGGWRTPLFGTARHLLARGAHPEDEITLRHSTSHTITMRCTVGMAARLTVEDGFADGPRFRP